MRVELRLCVAGDVLDFRYQTLERCPYQGEIHSRAGQMIVDAKAVVTEINLVPGKIRQVASPFP